MILGLANAKPAHNFGVLAVDQAGVQPVCGQALDGESASGMRDLLSQWGWRLGKAILGALWGFSNLDPGRK
jgi:hypothetical protein